MNEEDLNFVLQVSPDPDLAKVDEFLKEFATKVDNTAITASRALAKGLSGADRYRNPLQEVDQQSPQKFGSDVTTALTKSVASQAGLEATNAMIGAIAEGGALSPDMLASSIQELIKIGGKMNALPFQAVNAGFSALSQGLAGLQQQLGPIGVAFDTVSGAGNKFADYISSIPIVGDYVGPMVKAMVALPGIIKDILGTLTSFAALASPGQMQLFQMAVEDVQATIGQSFIPVLEMMRDAVRLVGDALATFLPDAAEVREALAGTRVLFDEMRVAITEMMVEAGPLVKSFFLGIVKGFGLFISGIAVIITRLSQAFTALMGPIRELLALIGINLPKSGGIRSSVGAAARQAQFSSFDEYQRQLQLSAYSEGTSSSMAQVPNMVSDIRLFAGNIADNIQTMLTVVRAIGTVLRATPEATIAPTNATAAAAGAVGANAVALATTLRQLLGF